MACQQKSDKVAFGSRLVLSAGTLVFLGSSYGIFRAMSQQRPTSARPQVGMVHWVSIEEPDWRTLHIKKTTNPWFVDEG